MTPGYAVISSPTTGNIYYASLPCFHDMAMSISDRPVHDAAILIDGKGSVCQGWGCLSDNSGLKYPEALAIHHGAYSNTLYVADTQAEVIYAYDLYESPLSTLHVGYQRVVLEKVVARGLAVDDTGNLFFTSPDANQISVLLE